MVSKIIFNLNYHVMEKEWEHIDTISMQWNQKTKGTT